MVKHMIIWKFNDGVENKEDKALEIKAALEGLLGKIDGLTKMEIIINKLPSSSGDIMMDSEFVNNDALMSYQKHPLHVEIANGIVCPAVKERLSLDYEA
ncbi:MAG: Dabb family protein [Clostridia bacterium]|nr:Dabb family protein [Clostridia bacterium]